MKVKIFNQGKGWYISATNYKDNNDKAYMNVHFAQSHCAEPTYQDNGRGFSVQDIDIIEAKFTSYKNKVGLTIFKYELLTNVDLNDTSNFGGSRSGLGSNVIEPDDLPFY
jgi:hypothetical protein